MFSFGIGGQVGVNGIFRNNLSSVLHAPMGMHTSNKKILRCGQIYMKDAESVESKEKYNFRFFWFLFFELSWKFIENWGDLSTKMTITRKNRFFLWFSTFRIFHVSLTTFENKNYFDVFIPMHANTEKTIAKYAVDANLFQLGSNQS